MKNNGPILSHCPWVYVFVVVLSGARWLSKQRAEYKLKRVQWRVKQIEDKQQTKRKSFEDGDSSRQSWCTHELAPDLYVLSSLSGRRPHHPTEHRLLPFTFLSIHQWPVSPSQLLPLYRSIRFLMMTDHRFDNHWIFSNWVFLDRQSWAIAKPLHFRALF